MEANSVPDPDAWTYRIPPDELLGIVCPPIREPRPITHAEPLGALKLWGAEIRAGLRTTVSPSDALARAAGYELNGLDSLREAKAVHQYPGIASQPRAEEWCRHVWLSSASMAFARAEEVLAEAIALKRKRREAA